MGKRTRRLGVKRIEAHCRERKHLKIDPRLIHVGNSAFAKVKKFGLQFGKQRRKSFVILLGGAEEGFGDEVALQV